MSDKQIEAACRWLCKLDGYDPDDDPNATHNPRLRTDVAHPAHWRKWNTYEFKVRKVLELATPSPVSPAPQGEVERKMVTHNGNTYEIAGAELTDEEVAHRFRMLTPGDLSAAALLAGKPPLEYWCVLIRDRILYLSQELTRLRALGEQK